MRLLNTKTLQIEEFLADFPQYAILSHTWGAEEVTVQDMRNHQGTACQSKQGYRKIAKTCEIARGEGLGYAWVDTCCIDKTSSSELSEAINSMFACYRDAKRCYAWLSDVPLPSHGLVQGNGQPSPVFAGSKWFTRGWTLQKLIAPANVTFYNSKWEAIGTRASLCPRISKITKIHPRFLNFDNMPVASNSLTHDHNDVETERVSQPLIETRLATASIAERMSWAATRKTTRVEDEAYSLLGLFGINIPLIYGEGRRAFLRLQKEIIRRSDDHSIFAWNIGSSNTDLRYKDAEDHQSPFGIFADSPSLFLHMGHIVPCKVGRNSSTVSLTNKGVAMRLPMSNGDLILECRPKNDPTSLVTIPVRRSDSEVFYRSGLCGVTDQSKWDPYFINHALVHSWNRKSVQLSTKRVGRETDEDILFSLVVSSSHPGTRIWPETSDRPSQMIVRDFTTASSEIEIGRNSLTGTLSCFLHGHTGTGIIRVRMHPHYLLYWITPHWRGIAHLLGIPGPAAQMYVAGS